MLIAMMSNSYQLISEHSDTEWKFARSELWVSYFEEGATVPPPFNLLPSVKILRHFFRKKKQHHANSFMVMQLIRSNKCKFNFLLPLLA